MPNIQTLFVIKDEAGTLIQADSSYDLSTIVGGLEVPKEVGSAYIIINGDGTVSEYTYPKAGSKYVTKVTNQATGDVAYLDEKPGVVSDLLVNDSCTNCQDIRPASQVEIVSSCTEPVYVKICDPVGQDRELIFTDSEPICVTDAAGATATWLVRERIVWDSVTYTEISRVTEYSADGLSWSTTAPTGTIALGSCEAPVLDCELIITTPVPLCVRFESTAPSSDPCCGVKPYIYQSWVVREVINWDSSACTEISRVTEYSSDGVTWTTTAPANATLGECPKDGGNTIDDACCPSISDAFGNDLSTLEASHNYSITKPSCCTIKVTTSIGSFTIPANIQGYNTSDFKCTYTIDSIEVVSGTCSLADVHIIGNKLK